MNDAGYTNEDLTERFEVSKQRIYDAKKRLEPILSVLDSAKTYRRDMRDKDVQNIVDGFSDAFGNTKTSMYDRYAAKRLHIKYDSSMVIKIIQALASHTTDKYAPTVNNVSQLEEKWVQVGKFLQTKSSEGMIEL